jgi:hypothetical protein
VASAGALVPPAPEQVSAKVVLAVKAPVLWVPPTATVPLQPAPPPEAVQDVALVELQVRVEASPFATVVGCALRVAVGSGGAVTVTVTLAALLVPPAPVQVSEYEVLLDSAPVLCVPLTASAPLQPPAAVQPVALVELQVRVADPPVSTVAAETLSEAVGTGGGVTVEDPPSPPPPQAASTSNTPVGAIRNQSGMFTRAHLYVTRDIK